MSKSLATAKVLGGGVLGGGSIVGAGYGITKYFKSEETSTTPNQSPESVTVQQETQNQERVEQENTDHTPKSPGSETSPGAADTGKASGSPTTTEGAGNQAGSVGETSEESTDSKSSKNPQGSTVTPGASPGGASSNPSQVNVQGGSEIPNSSETTIGTVEQGTAK